MSEIELQQLAQEYDSLTNAAQTALRTEFANRHLEPPVIEDPIETPEPAARKLVTVRRYRDLSEAIVARSLLESAGIAAWVRDENVARMEWQYSNLLGGIRLQVEASDAEAAAEVLDQPIPDAIPFDSKEDFVQPRCPRCGSIDISFLGSDRRAALASVTLLSIPLPRGIESWTCYSCGARWEETENDGEGTSS
ncbi:MAG TPA: DUF2007 domain-containing protein [Acidobacteriaceae bacterium]|nr:DUF2007 domain-containing protein [Acidobacteriaceae bacterium]